MLNVPSAASVTNLSPRTGLLIWQEILRNINREIMLDGVKIDSLPDGEFRVEWSD